MRGRLLMPRCRLLRLMVRDGVRREANQGIGTRLVVSRALQRPRVEVSGSARITDLAMVAGQGGQGK